MIKKTILPLHQPIETNSIIPGYKKVITEVEIREAKAKDLFDLDFVTPEKLNRSIHSLITRLSNLGAKEVAELSVHDFTRISILLTNEFDKEA